MDETVLLREIKNLIKNEFDVHDRVLKKLIETKVENRIKELESKLLDWKSEIMNAVDTFALEIKESREFREIIGHQTTSNTDRIENLEKKTFGAVVGDV